MASRERRPPLTPADCTHLGRGLDDLEMLRWESQSREGKRHYTYGTLNAARDCSCEWRQNNPDRPCKHMLAFVDALAHHLGDPAPADPGGAALERAQADVDDELGDWLPALLRDHMRRRFDAAVTAGGDRWIVGRTAAGVRLTCVACHAVRGWASEGMATAWLEGGGVCGCGGAGPTPPASAARKPLDECLLDLYGDS